MLARWKGLGVVHNGKILNLRGMWRNLKLTEEYEKLKAQKRKKYIPDLENWNLGLARKIAKLQGKTKNCWDWYFFIQQWQWWWNLREDVVIGDKPWHNRPYRLRIVSASKEETKKRTYQMKFIWVFSIKIEINREKGFWVLPIKN